MKTFTVAFLAFIAFVFNWFFFWLVGSPSGVQWFCWAVLHAVLAVALIFGVRTSWKGDLSALLLTPAYILAGITVIVTAALSCGFIVMNPGNPMVPLTAYVILFAAAAGIFVTWGSVSKDIKSSEAADKSDRMFLRRCAAVVESIIQSESDLDRQKELEIVYDALRSAQITSIPEVRTLETQIENDVNLLQTAVENKEPTAEIERRLLNAIDKRNRMIMSNR